LHSLLLILTLSLVLHPLVSGQQERLLHQQHQLLPPVTHLAQLSPLRMPLRPQHPPRVPTPQPKTPLKSIGSLLLVPRTHINSFVGLYGQALL
jgi:hypothetical protein